MAWTISWNTQRSLAVAEWNTALAPTERGALDLAHHFLRLKFVVFAINRPDGTVYMDKAQLQARFNSPIRNA